MKVLVCVVSLYITSVNPAGFNFCVPLLTWIKKVSRHLFSWNIKEKVSENASGTVEISHS